MFQTKVVEKLGNFFSENHAIYEIKCRGWGQATGDNMANGHCILDS